MKGGNSNLLIIGGVAVVVVVAALFFMGRPEPRLINSATGFEGFRVWLVAQNHPARTFTGGYTIDPDGVGLRILPTYDLRPNNSRAVPRNREDLLTREDERDLSLRAIQRKAEAVPTLLVLPKWRSAVRLAGAAHPEFLNSETRVESLLEILVGQDAEITTDTSGFSDFEGAEIYALRTFVSEACEPVVGSRRGMLIGRCKVVGVEREVHILSDPDLINSHGLRFGENATLATAVVTEIAGEKDILIDYSPRVWTARGQGTFEADAREWSDLLNYFKPPFSVLWLGVITAFLLALWRGWARFGAAAKSLDAGPGATRSVATAAQARLLRISGDTGALLRAYTDARLLALAGEVFGTKAQATEAALWKVLERRAPAACKALREQAANLRQHDMGPAPMYAIDDFEEAIGQVRHELERTP